MSIELTLAILSIVVFPLIGLVWRFISRFNKALDDIRLLKEQHNALMLKSAEEDQKHTTAISKLEKQLLDFQFLWQSSET